MPVLSRNRDAARPVGAASSSLAPLAVRTLARTSRTRVFPTPGPPVMTVALDPRITSSADTCDGANSSRPAVCRISSNGSSMGGHGGAPSAASRHRRATRSSVWYISARKMQSVGSVRCDPSEGHEVTEALNTLLSAISASKEEYTASRLATSSAHRRTNDPSGSPQCPFASARFSS